MARKHKTNKSNKSSKTNLVRNRLSKNSFENNLNENIENNLNDTNSISKTTEIIIPDTNSTSNDTNYTSNDINSTFTTSNVINEPTTTTTMLSSNNMEIELLIDNRKKVNFLNINPQDPTIKSRLKKELFPKYIFTINESNNNIYYLCTLCSIVTKNYKQLLCSCNKKLLTNRSEFTEKCSLIRDYILLFKFSMDTLESTKFYDIVKRKVCKEYASINGDGGESNTIIENNIPDSNSVTTTRKTTRTIRKTTKNKDYCY
jgi:transcription antitermination factor NusG